MKFYYPYLKIFHENNLIVKTQPHAMQEEVIFVWIKLQKVDF